MASFQEVANKKVFGVKVLYLAAGFVVILGIVAWKLKPSAAGTDGTDTATDESGGDAPTPNPYDSLDSNGTVTVQQLGPQPTSGDSNDVETNDDWVREGSAWLVQQGLANGTDGYTALSKYVNGQDRTYQEQQMVDAWFKEHGAPPQNPAEGGSVAEKPVTKVPSLPGYHTVQGTTDNTYGKLANLYYGHSEQATYDLVQAANVDKLGMQDGPFTIGTKVLIPAYRTPGYYKTPSAMTSAQIASKNGITVQQIIALNNTTRSQWAKDATLRVH